MATDTRQPLSKRIGEMSPLWLGVAYTAATCLAMTLHYAAARVGARGLDELGSILGLAAIILLYIIITWYRDDDALPAGVLLTLTVLIGGTIATALARTLVERTIMAAIAVFVFSPMQLVVGAFLSIPIAAALVWIARVVSRGAERVMRTTPATETPARAGRPYQSVWERREAKRNDAKAAGGASEPGSTGT